MLSCMEINEEFKNALNEQITNELQAAMIYLQLSYDLDDLSFEGMRSWLSAQADEELEHAGKLSKHLLARGIRPEIGDISMPDLPVKSPLDAFNHAYTHEQKVSEQIRNLARVGDKVGDLDSRNLLNWFLNEQIEEEDTVSGIIDRIKLVGDDGAGLLRIDTELGKERTPDVDA